MAVHNKVGLTKLGQHALTGGSKGAAALLADRESAALSGKSIASVRAAQKPVTRKPVAKKKGKPASGQSFAKFVFDSLTGR